jgi:hypothetical protein
MDLCFDPLLKDYVHQNQSIKHRSPAPTELLIAPEHQPYFCGPRLNLLRKAPARESNQRPPTNKVTVRMQHLANRPVLFGTAALTAAGSNTSAWSLYNSDLTRAAGMLAHFDWAIYGLNSGHFWSTIRKRGLLFRVVLACDPFVHRRALLREVSGCRITTNGAPALLDHIHGSGITSKLTGYLIHSH